MTKENPYVVRKTVPAVKETLMAIPSGKSVEFDCRDFAPYSTIQASISRINKGLGRKEFSSTSPDNGATYTITRSR